MLDFLVSCFGLEGWPSLWLWLIRPAARFAHSQLSELGHKVMGSFHQRQTPRNTSPLPFPLLMSGAGVMWEGRATSILIL
jgi:hypothetical protein